MSSTGANTKPFQFTLPVLLWLTAVVAVGCAGWVCAVRLWGFNARGVLAVTVLVCPLLTTVVARTCPGATLTRAAAASGIVSLSLLALICGLGAVAGYPLGAFLLALSIFCGPWLLQGIVIFATVAYFGDANDRAEDPPDE